MAWRFAIVAGLAALLQAQSAAAQDPAQGRIDRVVTPERYTLEIAPDVSRMTFDGRETIRVSVLRPTRDIVLNAAELTVSRATVDGATATVSLDAPHERLTLRVAKALTPGKHILTLRYRGKINTVSRGLFAVRYDEAGKSKTALATQLESIDARRLLPCWDEPDRKAVFDISMITPKAQIAVSNMPVASVAPVDTQRQRTTFRATPKMSPYLLFLGSGEFVRRTRIVGGVELGVATTKAAAAKADFTLDTAASALASYDRYFGMRYPLPKLDFFIMPGSGRPVGMENWGAIFGFEGGFISDPKTSTDQGRAFVYLVIAHEVAHQWFGDLVTMKWWDDTWLNEGFASWMQVKASEAAHPEWRPELDAQQSRNGAMIKDASNETHPVIIPVTDPAKMDETFDEITYDKGQAIITMIEASLGEARFRAAVDDYVRTHANGNATSEDFWRALAKVDLAAAGEGRAFTGRPGLPLVHVSVDACVDGARRVRLSQARFTDAGAVPAQPWPIPLRLAEAGQAAQPFGLLGTTEAAWTAPGCGPVIVNAGQASYVRTDYDDASFAELVASFDRLSAADQMGLVDDQWALAKAGVAGGGRALSLLAVIPAKAPSDVWEEQLSVIRALDKLYRPGDERDRLRAFVRAQLHRATDGGADAGVKQEIESALASYDDPQAVAEARKALEQLLAGQPLEARERRVALGAGVVHADAALYDRIDDYLKHAASQDRAAMLDALSTAQDAALAERVLDLSISADTPPGQTGQMLIELAQRHPDLTKAFVAAHTDALKGRLRPVDLQSIDHAAQGDPDTPQHVRLRGEVIAWLAAHPA